MKIINVEQYDTNVKVFTSKKKFSKYLEDNYNRIDVEEYQKDIKSCDGFTLWLVRNGNDFIVYLPSKYKEDIIDHEIIHLTWFIGKGIGMPVNFKTQEFQAYLFTDLKLKIKNQIYGRGKKVLTKKVRNK